MKRFLFLIVLLCLLVTSACSNTKTKSLEEIYKDSEIEELDKVILQDGTTGASKTISEQSEITKFLSLIKDIAFTPQANQEKGVGWRYRITLDDGDKEFKFTTNKIGDTYYDSNPDILPIVDDYYKQSKIDEIN